MRRRIRPPRPLAFTLVEVLIVVLILGVLAAMVLPSFGGAANDSVRASLQRQIQSIEHQIEIYRVGNDGTLPTADPVSPMGVGGQNSGWGILVSQEYLSEEPLNSYTGMTLLIEGDNDAARALGPNAAEGWLYNPQPDDVDIYAAGYDRETKQLFHEIGG